MNLGATTGSVDFQDNNSKIDPYVFDGTAKFAGAGLTLGGYDPDIQRYSWQRRRAITLSCQAIQLGGARYLGCGPNVGIEFTISGGAGISSIRDVKWEDCGNICRND